jgi:Rps23 Pro-64 3,4-dihydroxylase Tpa1-like proline 4-hydroxylase
LAELNGEAFLGFLQEMTGIEGLISDPYYSGGGLHEIKRGGHLSIHADFNVHGTMNVERRLNLLVYLNDDWQPEYGGDLELWDRQMKRCEVKIAPLLGRAVIFSTNSDSFHGHPDKLACPEGRTRRSIATYYYTALPEGHLRVKKRTTMFQVRPGTPDQPDWIVKTQNLINDWVPPKLQNIAHRLHRKTFK